MTAATAVVSALALQMSALVGQRRSAHARGPPWGTPGMDTEVVGALYHQATVIIGRGKGLVRQLMTAVEQERNGSDGHDADGGEIGRKSTSEVLGGFARFGYAA